MRRRALIFDMDGVLVDSEPLQVATEKEVCRTNGVSVPDEEWRGFKGLTNRRIFSYISSKYADGQLDVEKLCSEKRALYLARVGEILPIPGALEFVERAWTAYEALALTTSNSLSIVERMAERFVQFKCFKVIITGNDIPPEFSKPDPFPYLHTLKELGLSPQDVYVIEDSDNGVLSASRADCEVVGITTSFGGDILQKAGAKYIVTGYEELGWLLSK